MKRLIAALSGSILFLTVTVSETFGSQTETRIFRPSFRTLKTEVANDFMAPPVIRLGSTDRILVSFDEIAEDNRYLSVRLIHCDSDWKPSRLVESEYLDGFNTMDIEDWAYSSNTFVHYVNYIVEIPSGNFAALVSGNYLLQVYDRDEPDETLLQTRFRVVEQTVPVSAVVTTRTDKGFNYRFQQLEIVLDGDGADIGNPYQDIKVEIVQNGAEGDSRIIDRPLRVEGSRIVYSHSPQLIFPASNEYRRFESVSTRFPGMRTDSVKYMGTNYHVWVVPDSPRADREYEFDRTQHGRFLVREYNATDSNIGADYVTVHFFLDSPEYIGQEVYIDGEMTSGQFGSSNLMDYNVAKGGYDLQLPLKQGAFNYRYVSRPIGSKEYPSSSLIEGDKYETGNEYNIYVYLRKPGDRYDRLVGYATVNSN